MSCNDVEYYRRRAASERTMAQAAASRDAAAVHNELAERYERLVRATERPTLHLSSGERLAPPDCCRWSQAPCAEMLR